MIFLSARFRLPLLLAVVLSKPLCGYLSFYPSVPSWIYWLQPLSAIPFIPAMTLSSPCLLITRCFLLISALSGPDPQSAVIHPPFHPHLYSCLHFYHPLPTLNLSLSASISFSLSLILSLPLSLSLRVVLSCRAQRTLMADHYHAN